MKSRPVERVFGQSWLCSLIAVTKESRRFWILNSMNRSSDNRAVISERFFAELCAQRRLRGFVFHSPRVTNDPSGEREAGDVVIWIRDLVIVFEIIWRNTEASNNTRRFVQRIGHKREQLRRDRQTYEDQDTEISMTNQDGETILFDHRYFNDVAFCGVVIVDSHLPLERLHFETIRKTLTADFSLAVMTTSDFVDLLVEVDTPSDLHYYLADRTRFLKQVFETDAVMFLDLNRRTERELIGFYKLNNNSFPNDLWKESTDKLFWNQYQTRLADQIADRDKENEESFIVDELIELIRKQNTPAVSTLQHSWELSSLTRRSRAGWLARRVGRGFEQMVGGRRERHFAFHNQATACWIVFYFCNGLKSEEFRQKAIELAKMKTQVERVQANFPHSVFCYAFRKSLIETGNTFDECLLVVEDAEDYQNVSAEDYARASKYFRGAGTPHPIKEFPS